VTEHREELVLPAIHLRKLIDLGAERRFEHRALLAFGLERCGLLLKHRDDAIALVTLGDAVALGRCDPGVCRIDVRERLRVRGVVELLDGVRTEKSEGLSSSEIVPELLEPDRRVLVSFGPQQGDHLAECEDAEQRVELAANIAALGAKLRRIPYIDPIDIRYRRFENEPKPVAQAVMFCLMDVSSSMSEHMKDLAKRFYMLLYIFLTRRYRHVEIVFVRHTDRAEEVDEETFFRSPATGGTMVSSALEAMRQIIATRYRPADWNIYAAQASDGDNSYTDGAATEGLLKDAILPVSQYFAYLEVGDEGGGSTSDSALWTLYRRLHSEGALLSMRKVSRRSEIFPVFHELFQRRRALERVAP